MAATTTREEEIVEQAFSAMLQSHSRPAESPLERAISTKLTGKHIELMLEAARLREQNRHQEATDRLKYQPTVVVLVILLVLVFVIGFAWLLLAYGKSELLVPVISAIVGLVTGGVGGYGLGRSQAKRDVPNP